MPKEIIERINEKVLTEKFRLNNLVDDEIEQLLDDSDPVVIEQPRLREIPDNVIDNEVIDAHDDGEDVEIVNSDDSANVPTVSGGEEEPNYRGDEDPSVAVNEESPPPQGIESSDIPILNDESSPVVNDENIPTADDVVASQTESIVNELRSSNRYNLRPRAQRQLEGRWDEERVFFASHLSLKTQVNEFGKRGFKAVFKELKQLVMKDVWSPIKILNRKQLRGVIRSRLFLKEKSDGTVKGRL